MITSGSETRSSNKMTDEELAQKGKANQDTKPVSDVIDREKLAKLIYDNKFHLENTGSNILFYSLADQIIALFKGEKS